MEGLIHSDERRGRRKLKFAKILIPLIVSVLALGARVSPASDCSLSNLDSLGRAGTVSAVLGPETIPDKDRSPISMFYPSGFRPNVKYDFIDGKYLYNRCHLIAFQLYGVDDERNLFTGTRYLNTHLMLPIENEVRGYIEETGHHVRYTVTPDFRDGESVCRGVTIEAYSVEDGNLKLAVYLKNVQPGVMIDYRTGNSSQAPTQMGKVEVYVLNSHTMKFHRPSCRAVNDIKQSNRDDYYGSRDDLLDMGYAPCKICGP